VKGGEDMSDELLDEIKKELSKLKDLKKKLIRSKKRNRIAVYKKIRNLEKALLDSLEKASRFGRMGEML
jgi:hypothetical protein